MISAAVEGQHVVLRGGGTTLLRRKAQVAASLGDAEMRYLPGVGIAFSKAHIPACAHTLQGLPMDSELQAQVNAWSEHASAVSAANKLLQTGSRIVDEGWRHRLDSHQHTAVSILVLRGLQGACLFDEQGTGKTVMALAAFDLLLDREMIDQLIVLSPLTMLGVWAKELDRFLGAKCDVTSVADTHPLRGSLGRVRGSVYLVNYDALPKVGVSLGALAQMAKTLLVVDESFYLKNDGAERTRNAMDLRARCARGWVLCGTPAPHSAADLIAQCDLADCGYTFGPVRPTEVALIQDRIESRAVMIRRLKVEVLPDLAPKRFTRHYIQLSTRQRWLYDRASREHVLELRGLDSSLRALDLRSALQRRSVQLQICSWPSTVDPSCTTNAKMELLDRLLKDLIDMQQQKVVVWSFYTAPLHGMFQRYRQYCPVMVCGESAATERSDAVAAFQGDDNVRLFLGNPAAAGAGITLTSASTAIYYSLSNRAADLLQSLDRIHRRGQRASLVNIHVLIAQGTLEEGEWNSLIEHADAQAEVLRDGNSDWHTESGDGVAK